MSGTNKQRITEEPETLEEAYECQRIGALPKALQQLVLLHQVDQFEAVSSYLEQQARRFVTEQNL